MSCFLSVSPRRPRQRMLRALIYAYVLGGVTFIPLLIFVTIFITVYTSVPVGDPDLTKKTKGHLETDSRRDEKDDPDAAKSAETILAETTNDFPRTRKGWLIVRRTFQEQVSDGSYVTLVRSFLDSRSKDPKRSRPKDMWYVVLKGTVLYLYEDEDMSECEAVIELSQHQVLIYPRNLPDAELFAKRNSIHLRPKASRSRRMSSVSRKMRLQEDVGDMSESAGPSQWEPSKDISGEMDSKDAARDQAMDPTTPWFIFVRSNVDMEDWYFALIHASEQPAQTPTLSPLCAIFDPHDMNHLVSTLDEQPDVIPMRWLNAVIGRIFFSHYRTQAMESYIIGRLMKKLSKVKIPAFLTEVAVTEVSVGNRAPMFSKPMLKELTKEGDASIEVHLQYKGEVRITVEATAVINLGARFKSYVVKLVLAAVLKELEGNLLIKVKRPPSNRIWYAFTQTPRMVMEVEPIVSDRQITWGMILSTIESKFKEIIQESVVMPNMDDIAFFDTENYEHRGGIWSDACRKPRVSASTPISAHEEGQSLPSASPDTATSLHDPVTSHKGDNASVHSAPPVITMSVEPSLSSNPDDNSDSLRNTPRRRTWFSSHSEDISVASAPNLMSDVHQGDKPENERRLSQESDSLLPAQLQLSPDQPETRSTTADLANEQEPPRLAPSLSISSRRSVSQHSIKTPQDTTDQEPQNKSTPTTPRKNSDASELVRPTSPPSFFHALKSKTADKQAIKETAKEAMRKWGVNWGGFKKDANAASQDQSGGDNIGNSSSRSGTLQTDGSGKSLTPKPRASYAEVRAAVVERKERERMSQLLDPGSEALSEPSSPETARMRVHNTLDPSSSKLETSVNAGPATRISSPSGFARKKSSISISRMNAQQETEQDLTPEEPSKPVPIHVQPVAKTMSIPGIHASHRGEVQSMGYIAPQPQPPATSGPMTETMLKNPALQTVYRLLKPSNNSDRSKEDSDGQVPVRSHLAQEVPLISQALSLDSTDNQTISVATSPIFPSTGQLAIKSTPPPLPPRSNSSAVIYHAPQEASNSSSLSHVLNDLGYNEEGDDSRTQVDNNNSTSSPAGSDLLTFHDRTLGVGEEVTNGAQTAVHANSNSNDIASVNASTQSERNSNHSPLPSRRTSIIILPATPDR